ncbi:MAG: bifunctional 3-deoxy-7-phosphoheptulonate synthase/chorismate mutase [Planctomycetota bacterium]
MNDQDRNKETGVEHCRQAINVVDEELLTLFARRREISREIVETKDQQRAPIRDQRREETMLASLIQLGRKKGLDAHYVTSIFHAVIQDSLRIQQQYLQSPFDEDQDGQVRRVAFLGIEGSYSHLAAGQHFAHAGHAMALVGCSSLQAVARAVEHGEVDFGILPIENTTSGGILESYDLLLHAPLSVVGEEKLKIEHCLIGFPDSTAKDIRSVISHPQALSQCSRFVEQLVHGETIFANSTAEAVQSVARDGDHHHAAIANEKMAEQFGLAVLKRGIANHPDNYTRFLVVGREPREVDPRIPCKTSLVMSTNHKPGSLVEALLSFRNAGLNLTKLESRPVPDNAWEEMFYLDFEGNTADGHVQSTLEELRKVSRFIRVLGSYPSHDLADTTIAPELLLAERQTTSLSAKTDASVDGAADVSADSTSQPPVSKVASPKGYRLASREHRAEDTIIEVRGVEIGGPQFIVIAGPCSVESHDQIMICAQHAREHSAHVLRGGCFKPRTSPYSFQGLEYEGLDYLAKAGRTYGMPIITEVLDTDDVVSVAEKADILQIGARNMQNFALLKAVGRVHRPVMLKRGLMSSLDELLHAAEYILANGNQQVFLCERGIRTFETSTRNTLDLSAIPILKKMTHLPVFIDPSHAVGQRDLVRPMALAGQAAGAHGMMVEFHPEPEKALSDGAQSLRFAQFADLMAEMFRG